MEKSLLFDDFVIYNKKLARLKEETNRLKKKEEDSKMSEQVISEPEDIKIEEADCAMCQGDSKKSSPYLHIQNLCPADRKRIARLVNELAMSTEAKNKAEMDVVEIKAENEALLNRYELFCSKQEDEKSKLKSKLLETTAKLNNLRLRTANSLDILTEQVKAQEEEYNKLTETVKDLLREKIKLENSLRIAESSLEQIKESAEIEKMLSLKKQVQSMGIEKVQESHQAEEMPIQKSDISFELPGSVESQIPTESRVSKNSETKSKDDLEIPSPDGKIIEELFFKHPSVEEDFVMIPGIAKNLF